MYNNDTYGGIAPTLCWNGDKFNFQGTYDKKTEKGYLFYQIPIKALSFLYRAVQGKNGNVIKLITFLVGSGKGLGVSEKLIEERLGLSHTAYCNARKWLIENEPTKRYFIYDKKYKTITIDYCKLWDDQMKEENRILDEKKKHYDELAREAEFAAFELRHKSDEFKSFKTEYTHDLKANPPDLY